MKETHTYRRSMVKILRYNRTAGAGRELSSETSFFHSIIVREPDRDTIEKVGWHGILWKEEDNRRYISVETGCREKRIKQTRRELQGSSQFVEVCLLCFCTCALKRRIRERECIYIRAMPEAGDEILCIVEIERKVMQRKRARILQKTRSKMHSARGPRHHCPGLIPPEWLDRSGLIKQEEGRARQKPQAKSRPSLPMTSSWWRWQSWSPAASAHINAHRRKRDGTRRACNLSSSLRYLFFFHFLSSSSSASSSAAALTLALHIYIYIR